MHIDDLIAYFIKAICSPQYEFLEVRKQVLIMKTFSRIILNKAIVVLLALLMIFTAALSVFAAGTQVGTSGDPFAGAATNTFAQNMNLQQIYLDQSVLAGAENSPQASFTSTAIAKSTDSDAKGVYLKASEIPTITDGKGSKNFTDVTWSYTYPEAAILPDGSKKKRYCYIYIESY